MHHFRKWMISSLIFQKFSGEGLTEPPPQTPPPAFSRASPSVRASPSILGRFAPSTRASPSILGRFAPSIRASPSTFDWGPWFGPPQNKFLDPPLNLYYAIACLPRIMLLRWRTPTDLTTNTETNKFLSWVILVYLQFSSIHFMIFFLFLHSWKKYICIIFKNNKTNFLLLLEFAKNWNKND